MSAAAPTRDAPGPRLGKRLRRLAMGLATLTGAAPRGWFIPYRYAGETTGGAAQAAGYPALAPLFEAAEPAMRALLDAADADAKALLAFRGAAPPAPRWEQGWYPRLDGLAAFCLTRRLAPARILEVGSGHSTRFFAAAADPARTRIDAVDPAPRADLGALPGVTLHRRVVQAADPALFAGLAPGDVLAIDSSHVAMPGSDVDWLVGRAIPTLPAGAYLAIHDVFLPDPYPAGWAWRGYNEQTVAAALLAGGGWRVVWSSHWAATRLAGRVAAGVAGRLPRVPGAAEGALWLERLAGPATAAGAPLPEK